MTRLPMQLLLAFLVAASLAACDNHGNGNVSETPLEGAACVPDRVPYPQYYFCPGDDHNVCPALPSCVWTCDGGKWRWSVDVDGGMLGLTPCPAGSIWDYRGCLCGASPDVVCTGTVPGGCSVACSCSPDGGLGCVIDHDGGTSCPTWP